MTLTTTPPPRWRRQERQRPGARGAAEQTATSTVRAGPTGRLVAGSVAVAAGLLASTTLQAGHIRGDAVAFGLVWAGCLVLLADHHPARYLSPAGLYLLVFGLFHGGLLFSVALRGPAGYVSPLAANWINGTEVPGAVRLSIIGCVAFTAAVLIGRSGVERRRGLPAADPVLPADRDDFRVAADEWVAPDRDGDATGAASPGRSSFQIGLVGLACLGFGLLVTVAGVVLGGALTGGYTAVLASAQGNSLLVYGVLFIGFGAVFSAVGTPAQRRLGLGAFGAFALVAVPLGLRGPVLFVVATVLAVEVRRGLRIRPLVAIVLAIALLMVIGVVRETRIQGPGALIRGDWSAGPMDAVGEMGFSLYPAVVVRQWHDQGEPFRHGSTLAAVPLRFAQRIIGPPPPDDDRRLFNVEVLDRVGPIGGSPIAEGYHNFGIPGVVGLMAAIGMALAVLDRRRSTAASDALLAVVMLPLVAEVRNFFAAVPAQMFVGLVVLGIALLIPRRTRADAARAFARR